MDERKDLPGHVDPGQIREGAGLDESRINQDFVDLLKKFSTPILLIILIAAAAYYGLNYYRQAQAQALDTAFLELDQAQRAGSPDGLVAVATAHEGQRAVPHLARLAAADLYLASARTRVAVAAPLNADGTPQNEADLLTEEQRNDQLEQAARLYQRVLDGSASTGSNVNITAINAMFGLAAVAETRGDTAAAANWYTRIADRSAVAGLTKLEQVAKERKASLDQISEAPALYSVAQLPAPPAPPAAGFPGLVDSEGNPIKMERVEFPPGMVPPGVGIPGDQPEQPVMPRQPGENDGIPLAPGSATPPTPPAPQPQPQPEPGE